MISKKPYYALLKHLATPAALIIAVLLALPAQVSAQFLALDGSAYDIGEPVTLFYTVPDRDDFPKPTIGIFRPEDGAQLHAKRNIDHGSGDISLPAPNRAGRFEARLYHGDQVYAVRPFQTLVPPAPGALGLDWQTVLAGEPVVLSISVPERRFLGSGAHVGHYWPGEPGGSDHAPQLPREILSKSLGDARQATLTFTAPDQPGTYLFRLFDRYESHDPYLLDEITYAVELPPTPGALSLEKLAYLVGENISLAVELPDGRYIDDYAYVAMINPQIEETVDVAAGGPRQLVSKPIVGERQTTLSFTAPDRPGRYLFRLYDRRESWDPFILDEIVFAAVATRLPGSISLQNRRFAFGEAIEVGVSVADGRFLHNTAPVSLVQDGGTVSGGAEVLSSVRQSQALLGNRTATMTFNAPAPAGQYRIELADRNYDWDAFVIDALTITTFDPADPGAQAAITPAPPVPQTEPQAARAAACSRYLEGAGPQNVEIASISIVDPETLDTVDSVRLGEPIRVRLTLAADPGGQVTYIVAIEISGGQGQNIQVSGAEKVILSDPIFVTAAANEDEP